MFFAYLTVSPRLTASDTRLYPRNLSLSDPVTSLCSVPIFLFAERIRNPSDPEKMVRRAAHSMVLQNMSRRSGRSVEVHGRHIALFRFGASVFAVDALCPHQGGSLVDGEIGDIEDMGTGFVCSQERKKREEDGKYVTPCFMMDPDVDVDDGFDATCPAL